MAECNACKGTGSIVGLSGQPKDCPRCTYPVLTAQREARQRKRFSGYVLKDSMAHGPAHAVLLVLALHADEHGVARVAYPDVATMCRISPSTARESLKKLVAIGELIEVESGGGRSNCNAYALRVIIDKLVPE